MVGSMSYNKYSLILLQCPQYYCFDFYDIYVLLQIKCIYGKHYTHSIYHCLLPTGSYVCIVRGT